LSKIRDIIVTAEAYIGDVAGMSPEQRHRSAVTATVIEHHTATGGTDEFAWRAVDLVKLVDFGPRITVDRVDRPLPGNDGRDACVEPDTRIPVHTHLKFAIRAAR